MTLIEQRIYDGLKKDMNENDKMELVEAILYNLQVYSGLDFSECTQKQLNFGIYESTKNVCKEKGI